MPAYRVEGLSVSYAGPGGARGGAVKALDGLDLDVGRGELLVVLGPTGAGKTTLLRALAGLERPSAGRILEVTDGGGLPRDISALPPHRRDAAMVFQNFSLYPRLSVRDNLAFPLRSRALALDPAGIEARVKEAAGFLGLADKLDRMPRQLSGGELQRVALGRALVRRPRLFLLDEPLANLDAKLRERMVVEIRRLQRSLGAAMIYVTHDHAEAMSLADRIVVLDRGRALQAGPPDEIYRHPANARVARMLGRPSVNVFDPDTAARLGFADTGGRLLAVRPESWRVTADPQGPALVKGIEHLGPRLALVLDVQGVSLRAVAGPALRIRPGERARLAVDPSDLMLLDR